MVESSQISGLAVIYAKKDLMIPSCPAVPFATEELQGQAWSCSKHPAMFSIHRLFRIGLFSSLALHSELIWFRQVEVVGWDYYLTCFSKCDTKNGGPLVQEKTILFLVHS